MDTVRSWYDTWVDYTQPKKVDILKKVAFAFYVLFLFVLVIYAFGRTGTRQRSPAAVVVFMDVNAYDFQALRYLAQRRDVTLAMLVLSRSHWSTMSVARSAAVLRNFIDALQDEGYDAGKLQLAYSNATDELSGVYDDYGDDDDDGDGGDDASDDDDVMAMHNKGGFAANDDDDGLQPYEEALDALLAKQSVSFLVLGPCTDVAHFLQAHASRRGNVQSIVVAGGAFQVPGNVQAQVPANSVAERNFYLDAAAANYVTLGEHGRPVVLLPLDATMTWQAAAYNTLVTSRLHNAHSSAGMVADMLDRYYDKLDMASRPVALEVLAACLLADAQLQNGATVTRMVVSVRHDVGDDKEGLSFRPSDNPFNTLTTVVLSLPQSTFWQHLLRVDALPLS